MVALKILAPALAADEAFRQRFIRESRAAAAVDDPHIIPVFEAGEADGVLFIAMRFVAGGDVRSLVRREGRCRRAGRRRSSPRWRSALDAAHAAGLVHRDVKPANMLVDARPGRPDHVYLSDFGLSKGALSSTGLTGTGLFLGTPDYTAPEQIEGQAVDGRADQYCPGLRGVRAADRGAAVPARRGHGGDVRARVRAAAPADLTAARTCRRRWTRCWPGAGEGPGGPVPELPGVRRRAARGARAGGVRDAAGGRGRRGR